jgi:hypothetical protein
MGGGAVAWTGILQRSSALHDLHQVAAAQTAGMLAAS